MFVLLLCQSKERRKRNLGCLPEHLQLEDEGIIFQATHLTTLFPELVFCLVLSKIQLSQSVLKLSGIVCIMQNSASIQPRAYLPKFELPT